MLDHIDALWWKRYFGEARAYSNFVRQFVFLIQRKRVALKYSGGFGLVDAGFARRNYGLAIRNIYGVFFLEEDEALEVGLVEVRQE